MKEFNELTHEELISLTNQEIQKYIDLKIAEEGIKFVPEPDYKDIEIPKFNDPDSQPIYKVRYNVGFFNEKDATTYISLMKEAVCVNEKDLHGEKYHVYSEIDGWEKGRGQVEIVKASSNHKLKEYEEANALILEEKERLKNDVVEYNNFLSATKEIRSSINEKIQEAIKFQKRIDLAKQAWERYVKLADGNDKIASRFFNNAYKEEPEIIEKLFPSPIFLTTKNI